MGFRNEYDGHTLERALDQHEKLSGNRAKSATVDRGYRGKTRIGETMINQNGLFKTRLFIPGLSTFFLTIFPWAVQTLIFTAISSF